MTHNSPLTHTGKWRLLVQTRIKFGVAEHKLPHHRTTKLLQNQAMGYGEIESVCAEAWSSLSQF